MSSTRSECIKRIPALKSSLENAFPVELVEEMFNSYDKVQQDYFLADYRPLCMEAARFAEVGIRMLLHATTGKYVPMQLQIQNVSTEVARFAQLPATSGSDSIRLLIPRTLQIIYDVRNKRNIGHTGGDVDENFADATLALTCCNWVLAELTRIFYTGDIDLAQTIVDSLVEIKLPMIQDFDGFLKVLDPDLSIPAEVLVLLHHRDKAGAAFDELTQWIGTAQRSNLRKRLPELVEQGFLHKSTSGTNIQTPRYFITLAGEKQLASIVGRSTISK